MFGFFEKSTKARQDDDSVWASDAARRAGLVREVDRAVAAGANVVVVALVPAALEELLAALEPHAPLACRDVAGQKALRLRLAQPAGVGVALASALDTPTGAPPPWPSPLEILVCGRHDRRAGDEALVSVADSFGAKASIAFHLSFDDPLLAEADVGPLRDVMQRLGMTDREAVKHNLLTRTIEKAQHRRSRG